MDEKMDMSLKLLIDKGGQRILYAEAGKDFVDLLFGFLAMPIGSALELVTSQTKAQSQPGLDCSILRIKESVENLSDTYIRSGLDKSSLVQRLVGPTSGNNTFDYPRSSGGFYSFNPHEDLTAKVHVLPEIRREEGYVKGVVTYMVTDDLVVTPMSTISTITLLNRFNIKDVSSLEEKLVHVRFREALSLLAASFQSKTALTDVFFTKLSTSGGGSETGQI